MRLSRPLRDGDQGEALIPTQQGRIDSPTEVKTKGDKGEHPRLPRG